MEENSYWDIVLERNADPCLLVNTETYDIVDLNEKMQILFGEDTYVVGKKFYDIIKNEIVKPDGTIEKIPSTIDWHEGNQPECHVYDSKLHLNFGIETVIQHYKGESVFVMKCLLDADKAGCDYSFEKAVTEGIAIMQEEEKNRIPKLLEVVGRYYQSDRTYLHRVDYETKNFACINYWKKNSEVATSSNINSKIDMDKIIEWIDTRDESGIIQANCSHDKDGEQNETLNQVLELANLNNMVACVIEDEEKEAMALLLVCNSRKSTNNFRLLQAISKFVTHDITYMKIKERICQETNLDLLTNFHTRISYGKRVEEIQNHPPKSLGVIHANVNGLKMVNSQYGYIKGDNLIKQSAKVIKEHFNTEFYRTAGDEFVGFCPDVDKEEFEKSCIELQLSLKDSGNNLFSIGHAWNTGKYDVLEMILEADTVMYINKQNYYQNAEVSYKDINDNTLSDLLSFLENDEFMIYLQPQVCLEDGSLNSAEALIRRYDKKNKKMVFPDQFIPLYEKKSIIRHVDIFVVEQVCKIISEWSKEGVAIPISINLSRVTLLEYGIVKTIADICDLYNVPRNLLVIEVTERVGLIENDVASSLILDFTSHGFKISLDDFGCAYSNIVTLSQIDVDEVKLDKSLVDNITLNNKNKVLVRNVLRMCNELDNTNTLAEGIETKEQGQMLYELGCRLGQGYYYSRPIPVDEFYKKYIEKK